MNAFQVTFLMCCVAALGSAAVVPAPSGAVPHPSYNAAATSYRRDIDPTVPYHSDINLAAHYNSDVAPVAHNSLDTVPEPDVKEEYVGSHLLHVINSNMGSVAAATVGSLFGPFGAFVSSFIQPPISQTLKHFSGGVISRENDDPLELFDN